MKVRLLKNVDIGSETFCKNENGWLKCVKWNKEKDYTYLIEIRGKVIEVPKHSVDFD